MQDFAFEMSYWGDCCNTFEEDIKHYTYARLMGLTQHRWSFIVGNKSVLDIGGGPTSMLLKVSDLRRGRVYDPIAYPQWTIDRYNSKNIDVVVEYGENVDESGWDEVWIYNCLQHVTDPARIIENAKKSAAVLRIFEWVDIPPHDGHPHMLTKEFLDSCIGQCGSVIPLAENYCYGRAYFGEFNVGQDSNLLTNVVRH